MGARRDSRRTNLLRRKFDTRTNYPGRDSNSPRKYLVAQNLKTERFEKRIWRAYSGEEKETQLNHI